MADIKHCVSAFKDKVRMFPAHLPRVLTVEQARELIEALQRAVTDAEASAINKEAK